METAGGSPAAPSGPSGPSSGPEGETGSGILSWSFRMTGRSLHPCIAYKTAVLFTYLPSSPTDGAGSPWGRHQNYLAASAESRPRSASISGPHATDRGSGQARGHPREVHDEPRHRIAGLVASQGAARSQGQYGLMASPDSAQPEGGTGSDKPGRHTDGTMHGPTASLGGLQTAKLGWRRAQAHAYWPRAASSGACILASRGEPGAWRSARS